MPEARKALDTLLEHLEQKIEVIEKAASDEIEELDRAAAEERSGMDLGDDIDGELRERLRTKEKQIEKEKNKIKEDKNSKVGVLARSCSQVWIIYMQFMRRSEVCRKKKLSIDMSVHSTVSSFYANVYFAGNQKCSQHLQQSTQICPCHLPRLRGVRYVFRRYRVVM